MMIEVKMPAGILIMVSLLLFTTLGYAGVAVIGHRGDGIDHLTKHQVKRFYLGKVTSFSNGTHVEVIDLPVGNAIRDDFYKKIVGKSKSQVKAYWSKRIFTGKGTPPKALDDAGAVKHWVADGAGRLGYIDSKSVDDSVTVLFSAN